MRIGFVGLGKLALPCALAAESRGHDVIGCDTSEAVHAIVKSRTLPYREEGAQEALTHSRLRVAPLAEVVEHAELLFVAVQTPHDPRFEGITRLPEDRADFDYSHLVEAVKQVSAELDALGQDRVVAIVSTVLPGTIDREVLPIQSPHMKLVYNPFFIAMGTAMPDFLTPEFVLLGVDDDAAAARTQDFYATIHERPLHRTTIRDAELIKVAYNTFIGMKIAFANTLMEFCHKRDCDVDAVTQGLSLASERLLSPMYLRGGMGDGGGCHPRDNIALSWLAREVGLSHDLFEDVMIARERQCDWLADLMLDQQRRNGLPLLILGIAYKESTNLTIGSHALLLQSILEERGAEVETYDPHVHGPRESLPKAVYLVGARHPEFEKYAFPRGSVVLDPWRYIPDQAGVEVIRLGQASASLTA